MNYRVHNPVVEQEEIAGTLQHVANLYDELCQVLEGELYSYAEEDYTLSSGSEMDHLIMEINEFLARLPKRGLKSRKLKPVLTAHTSDYVDELQEYIDEVDSLGDYIAQRMEDFGYEFRRSRHSNPASQAKCDKLRTKLANAQAKVVDAQKRLDEACAEAAEGKPAKRPKKTKPPKGGGGGGASGGGGGVTLAAEPESKPAPAKAGGKGKGKAASGEGRETKPKAEVPLSKYGRFESAGEAHHAAEGLARKILPTHEFPENKHFANALLHKSKSKIRMGDAEPASPVAANPAGMDKGAGGIVHPVVRDIQGGSPADAERLTGEVTVQQRQHPKHSVFFAVDPDGNFAVDHGTDIEDFKKTIAKYGFGAGCVIVKMPPMITGEEARDKAYNKALKGIAERFCGAFTKSQAAGVRKAISDVDAELPAGSTPIVPEIATVAPDGTLVPGVDMTPKGQRKRKKDAEQTPIDAGEVAQDVEEKPKRARPPRAATTKEPRVQKEPGRRGRPAKPKSDDPKSVAGPTGETAEAPSAEDFMKEFDKHLAGVRAAATAEGENLS